MNAATKPLSPIDGPRPMTRSGNRRPGRSWPRSLLAPAFALWFALNCGYASAAGLEGRFLVRSADLELSGGVYQLNARFELPIGDAVREELAQGVPLTLEIDMQINRVRQLLPNSGVASITQRYHLQYNAVSAQYVLRNENSGQQESLPSLDAALEEMSQVRGLPVLDKALLSDERHYEASLRAKVDFGTVPKTVRILMFWVNDWHRDSDWYTWTLQP